MPSRVGPGLGARVGHYPITRVMVTLYAAAMLMAPSLMAGGGRLKEFAGVFPWGVLVDGWAAAFVALLGLISTAVYV